MIGNGEEYRMGTSKSQIKAWRIYAIGRAAGAIAVFVPLMCAMLSVGLFAYLELLAPLWAFLVGALFGRIITLIIDRKLAKRAKQADLAERRAYARNRESEYQKQLKAAKRNGVFARFGSKAKQDR